MALQMPVLWSDKHRLHEPSAETWVGIRIPAAEIPARAEAIRSTSTPAGAVVADARAQPDDALVAVHDAPLLLHGFEEGPGA